MKKTTQPHAIAKKNSAAARPKKDAPVPAASAKQVMEKVLSTTRRSLVDTDTGEEIIFPKFKTQYNAKLFTSRTKEPGGGKSLTIPDQALTVPQIIKRSQAGMPLHVGYKQAYFEGEEGDLPDLRKLDLAELQQLREEAAIRVEEIKYALNKQEHDKNELRQKQREEQIKAEIKKQYEDQGMVFKKSS